MRRPWLAGDKRLLAVVDKAAKEAGWCAAREGHALGFACYTEERWLCRVAAVIDTSLVDGQPKVNRIVVAVDHGFSVNPDSVIAQIQGAALFALTAALKRSEEHTSELQSLMRISYAVFCLKKKNTITSCNNILLHSP